MRTVSEDAFNVLSSSMNWFVVGKTFTDFALLLLLIPIIFRSSYFEAIVRSGRRGHGSPQVVLFASRVSHLALQGTNTEMQTSSFRISEHDLFASNLVAICALVN